jgi:hypothetical protein
MKLSTILLQTFPLASILLATVVGANNSSMLGSYKSSGYTLDLESGGDYHSCDPQNRCLTIPHTRSSQQGNTRIWKQAGYTYRVTPVGKTLKQGHHTHVSVKILSPKQQIVFDRIFRSQ